MKAVRIYSPFYKIRRTLILLRWFLGFPLQSTDDSLTGFIFISRLEIFRFFVILSFPTILNVYLLLVFMTSDGQLQNFLDFYKGIYYYYSQNTIDHIVVVTWTMIILVVLHVNFFGFKRNANAINKFCNDFCQVKSNLESLLLECNQKEASNCHENIQSSEYLLLFGQILNIIATSLFCTWLYEVTEIISDGRNFQILRGILCFGFLFFYFLQVSSTLFGPMSCAVELMICQFINELAMLFDDWKKVLSSIPPTKICVLNKLKVDQIPIRRKRYGCNL